MLELIQVLRTQYRVDDPRLARLLVKFLSRQDVELIDGDRAAVVAAVRWSQRSWARRIPDAILAAAAEHARCEVIATFDEAFASPSIPVRLL